jgi:phosphohistidine phosphatase
MTGWSPDRNRDRFESRTVPGRPAVPGMCEPETFGHRSFIQDQERNGMIRRVMLLRHGKSSWEHEGVSDHDRPLLERGEKDAVRLGSHLTTTDRLPDLIISSTARRAVETARRVAEICAFPHPVEHRPELYLCEPEVFLTLFTELPDEVSLPLFVAHNPGLEAVVRHLTGRLIPMGTANLVVIGMQLPHWSDCGDQTRGTLLEHWSPKR